MTGPVPVANLVDGHASGEGYLASPRDGTLATLVATVGRLERDHDVTAGRRLGVSLEYVLAAREAGLGFAWGSPWIEDTATGPRNSIPAGQVDEAMVVALQGLGLDVLSVGGSCGRPTLTKIIRIARETRVEIAAVPSSHWVRLVDEGAIAGVRVTFESLTRLVDAVHRTWTASRSGTADESSGPADEIGGTGPMLAALAVCDPALVDRVTDWILASHVTLTPLMVAAWRSASLVNAVNAPALAQAATVLPYHARLASLRAPGALRMGGKEAARHLGIATVNHQDSRNISGGYARIGRTLKTLIENGQPLIGGSGAPGTGLCPGLALREELAHWSSLSKSSDHIRSAFGGVGESHELSARRSVRP